MKLSALIDRKAILVDVKAKDGRGVIKELSAALRKSVAGGKATAATIAAAVLARESKSGSSGLGHGIALPHAEVEGLKDVAGAFGRVSPGVDFSAIDGQPVDLFFLLCSPASRKAEYRDAISRLAQAIRGPNVLKFLRAAKSAKDVEEILREADLPAAAPHA